MHRHRALHALAPLSSPLCRPPRAPRCHSAGRVGVQPAAEPRHAQRRRHEVHVLRALRACPASSLHSWVAPARYFTASPSLSAIRPSPYASLWSRQDASAFNQPLSFDTSSVWYQGYDYMFLVRSARALPLLCSWAPACNCYQRHHLRTLISLSHRIPPFDLAEYTIFVQRQ